MEVSSRCYLLTKLYRERLFYNLPAIQSPSWKLNSCRPSFNFTRALLPDSPSSPVPARLKLDLLKLVFPASSLLLGGLLLLLKKGISPLRLTQTSFLSLRFVYSLVSRVIPGPRSQISDDTRHVKNKSTHNSQSEQKKISQGAIIRAQK